MIWEPSREWIEGTNVWRFMRRLGFDRLEDFLRFSREEIERFWDEMVRESGIEWSQPYSRVLDASQGIEWTQWFLDGRLNIASNCLDRHEGTAIVWEGEDGATRTLSFAGLREETGRLAHALFKLGLRQGDRVALLMPMVPEVVSVLYACCKLGLIAVPIFAGFGAGAIATRLEDAAPRAVVTADFLERRGRKLPLKDKLEPALAGSVEHVIVLRYRGGETGWDPRRDLWWDEMLQSEPSGFPSLPMDSESRALLLYTSGTAGKPKGTVHTHAGALAQMTKEIWLAFDHQPSDRFFWLSDIGWMMGPWAILGNHNFGGTVFLYDGAPDYPEPDRLWALIERHRITTLGISPTAIRLLMRKGADLARRHDLSSLRLLGSTGEPWDETSWLWYFENVGRRRCPVINISGGTELVGSFLFPLPIQPLKPCTLGQPAPGMAVEVFDESGHPVRGRTGHLVCTKPAPSMTRGIWRDPRRYLETYWSRWKGVWYHGDWASVDEDGHWFLHGRADESMNVAGRKVGPAEVEQALIQHATVSEAAVIGVPDELTGEAIVAFVVPKAGARPSSEELCAHLVEILGPTFRPRAIQTVRELPKTQSGKVVRRLLRQKYLGQPLGDLSTVENPGALEV